MKQTVAAGFSLRKLKIAATLWFRRLPMDAQSYRTLNTWDDRSQFEYIGSVSKGTIIFYGKDFNNCVRVKKDHYQSLIDHFRGQTVEAGTSKTNPPRNSVGKWLQENVTKTAIASYVLPILIDEKYAEKVGRTEIRFKI
jgi:hypothetical protein